MEHLVPSSSTPVCAICSAKAEWIGEHIKEHGIDITYYISLYPGSPTIQKSLLSLYKKSQKGIEKKAFDPSSASIDFAGISIPINLDVPPSACLSPVSGYIIPRHGHLGKDVQDVVISVKNKRSLWVHGPQGAGKDALFHAICSSARIPSLMFAVVQGADLQSWRFTRSFNANGTSWEEGLLLKAVRDGYKTKSGRVVPYLIVLSDIDRATRQQAEELRKILDTTDSCIQGPGGETYPVLPGTTITATANTAGRGDNTGHYISSNPMDSSILDRFERFVGFHEMDPRDEKEILINRYKEFHQEYPNFIQSAMSLSFKIREAIKNGSVYSKFSHRALSSWIGTARDLSKELKFQKESDLLKRSMRNFIDAAPNEESKMALGRVIDPHIKNGVI